MFSIAPNGFGKSEIQFSESNVKVIKDAGFINPHIPIGKAEGSLTQPVALILTHQFGKVAQWDWSQFTW